MKNLSKNYSNNYQISMFDNTPLKFRLYQNFPQAFYKITRIAFDVPMQSSVKLAIYDVFGREMLTLVDDQLNAGSYEVKWNAANFTTGVYYYKIMVNENVDSKKMILLNTVN
jgi:hypothetical protein